MMMKLFLLATLCVATCLSAHFPSVSDLIQLNELNAEEFQAARQWEDLRARKRELARDQGAAAVERGWEDALEVKEMENYLKGEELNVERRQSGDNCIQGDVIFILDSSGSIGIANWKLVLSFVNEAINRLGVGPKATHVGLVTFGNRGHIIFNLNNFTTSTDMAPHVTAARFLDENTNTSGGIYTALRVMFTEPNGDRPLAPNMGIVITDGESTYDHDKTIPFAQEAKNQGVLMISIGVGDKVSKPELDGIASLGGNGAPLVFQVGGYEMLTQIQDTLARVACDPDATEAPPCEDDVAPVKECDPVTCKNKCQYGFAPDENHCLTCGCQAKPACPEATTILTP